MGAVLCQKPLKKTVISLIYSRLAAKLPFDILFVPKKDGPIHANIEAVKMSYEADVLEAEAKCRCRLFKIMISYAS
jgi:hypothetical protein